MIYLSAYPFNGGPIVAQLRAAGLTVPIVCSQGVISELFLSIAGSAAEGVIVVDSHTGNFTTSGYQDFMRELTALKGDESPDVAVTSYASVQLVADAIKRAGSTDHDKVRAALASTQDLQTIRGLLIGFTADREIIQSMPVVIVEDKRFVLRGEIPSPYLSE